jgi:hypothetical protein
MKGGGRKSVFSHFFKVLGNTFRYVYVHHLPVLAVRADGHQEAKMRVSDSSEPIAEDEIALQATALFHGHRKEPCVAWLTRGEGCPLEEVSGYEVWNFLEMV